MPDSPLPCMSRSTLALIPLLALLLLGGCVTVPPDESKRESATTVEKPFDPQGVVEHGVDNRVIAMLWRQAEEARAEGDMDAAIRAIERTVDVEPDDAVLWSRLAELRLQAGQAAMAEELAMRSNSLTSGNRLLRYRNWLIIEAARREQGDQEGSDAARTELERLREGP